MANRTNVENEIRARVDSFVNELSALVRQAALDSIRAAIAGGSLAHPARRPGARATKTASAAPAGPGRRGRRPSAESEHAAQALLAHVQSSPGQRLEEIGAALKMPTQVLKGPAGHCCAPAPCAPRASGASGTRYFPLGKPAAAAGAKRGRKPGRKPGKAGRKGRRRARR